MFCSVPDTRLAHDTGLSLKGFLDLRQSPGCCCDVGTLPPVYRADIHQSLSGSDAGRVPKKSSALHNKIIELVNPTSLVSSAQLAPRDAIINGGNVAFAD